MAFKLFVPARDGVEKCKVKRSGIILQNHGQVLNDGRAKRGYLFLLQLYKRPDIKAEGASLWQLTTKKALKVSNILHNVAEKVHSLQGVRLSDVCQCTDVAAHP